MIAWYPLRGIHGPIDLSYGGLDFSEVLFNDCPEGLLLLAKTSWCFRVLIMGCYSVYPIQSLRTSPSSAEFRDGSSPDYTQVG